MLPIAVGPHILCVLPVQDGQCDAPRLRAPRWSHCSNFRRQPHRGCPARAALDPPPLQFQPARPTRRLCACIPRALGAPVAYVDARLAFYDILRLV